MTTSTRSPFGCGFAAVGKKQGNPWMRHGFVWLGLIALAGYGVLLGVNATIAAGGSDSSGYLNSARALASGRLESSVRLPAGFVPAEEVKPPHFQPLAFFVPEGSVRMLPTYPSGLPLHFALSAKILGWDWGVRLVELAAALAAVWLCFAVGREMGLDRWLAGAAAVVLAACPVMLFSSIQPLSDALATMWCLAAVWAALRARRHLGWAAACGAAYGVAVLVRPTNIVLLPALLVLLGLSWRRLAAAALGGLPAAAWLAFYNRSLYGGAFKSGYLEWSEFFAASYLQPASRFFLHWLVIFIPAVLLVLPLAALARKDTRTRELLALALWFTAITGLYLFCSFSHESWSTLRYILPALPALILAGMLGVEALARSCAARWATRLRRVAGLVLAAWAAGASWHWTTSNGVFWIKHHEEGYITGPAAAREHFSQDTLVLCCQISGALYYYTDFPILRYDALNTEQFTRYAAMAQQAGIAIGALLFTEEEQMALRDVCRGDWKHVATVGGMQLWRLNYPAQVPALSP